MSTTEIEINFEKMGGLVPAIVQDASTLQVLMLGYMNEESYRKTVATGKVTFFSRSRQTLWTKGETSGNFLDLVSIKVDCDNDTLLVRAVPHGPTCHKGTDTCWAETNDYGVGFLPSLQRLIESRKKELPEGSYTASLFKEGVNRMAQMVGEEALATLIGATHGSNEEVLHQSADLVYHLMVLLSAKGLSLEDVVEELRKRHKEHK